VLRRYLEAAIPIRKSQDSRRVRLSENRRKSSTEGVRKLLAIDLVYLDLGGTTVELIAYEGAAVDPAPQAQERRSAIRTGTASSLENGSVNEGCS
jgi:hypothetical protein